MKYERPEARVIPLRPRGMPGEPTRGLHLAVVELTPWPPLALEELEPVEEERIRWLDEGLVGVVVRVLGLLRALAQLPPATLDPGLLQGDVSRFRQSGHALTVTLEMLRLGQIGPDEAHALLPGLRRTVASLRSLRDAILGSLEPRPRAAVLTEEARAVIGPCEVEQELRERARYRTLREERLQPWMSVPGDVVLPMPDVSQIELRERRSRRLQVDSHPTRTDADLAELLEGLPAEWLEGIARWLGLYFASDRWEQERAIYERLTGEGGIARVLNRLTPLERRVVAAVVRAGGCLRYDQLILHYGADEETAWHWAEEPPTTTLERVRRCGLLYVGSSTLGRRQLRVAIIPWELRPELARLLESGS